ncbi:MAG: DUF1302 family protein [Piscinibacter sp.]|uniref:DUF1302 domain-containing protein n=1 Tax=Piscinibacter sp. TaxID=1903157 RepID=UPI0025897B64|nr:DUF1302 family protein [Piscinibacter sp.]MCW5667546.1 DUF1302 family protein [Piscinibacter sp.]
MTTLHALRPTALAAAAALACSAQAFEIETGHPDWSLRWDNSVRLSTKFRTEAADPALKDSFRQVPTGAPPPAPASFAFPQALNFNAGDQNFQKRGLVSARADLLSEFDAVWKRDFGLRLSAAAWYDDQLHRKTQADNDPTIGQTPFDEFPERTKKIAGEKAELLDAFVFGGWRLGNGMKLTARLGRHALQYGESLFFGDNGIARAQGPVDIDKLLASPNAQFKEIIRPVPQLSAQLQISPEVSLGGYVQFRWEEDRLAPAGSYFSTANVPWGSQQPEFVSIPAGTPISGNYVLTPGAHQKPKDSGQFGLQLKWRLGETDLGAYAARFHDKSGQLYGNLNPAAPPSPFGTLPGTWFYKFPADVKTVGVSASHSFGDFNVAGEASVRDDMPLRSTNMIYPGGVGAPQPQPALGRTAHLNLSTLATFGPSFIARESVLVAEIAWNRVLSKDDPNGELDKAATRDATALQFIYTPSYRQALPGLDLSVPVGLRYVLDGNSSVTGAGWGARGTGTATLGLEGSYLGVWQFAMSYTHYIGKAVPFVDFSPILAGGTPVFGDGNPLADRNHLALSLRRTF